MHLEDINGNVRYGRSDACDACDWAKPNFRYLHCIRHTTSTHKCGLVNKRRFEGPVKVNHLIELKSNRGNDLLKTGFGIITREQLDVIVSCTEFGFVSSSRRFNACSVNSKKRSKLANIMMLQDSI